MARNREKRKLQSVGRARFGLYPAPPPPRLGLGRRIEIRGPRHCVRVWYDCAKGPLFFAVAGSLEVCMGPARRARPQFGCCGASARPRFAVAKRPRTRRSWAPSSASRRLSLSIAHSTIVLLMSDCSVVMSRNVFARLPSYNPFVGTFHHAPRCVWNPLYPPK